MSQRPTSNGSYPAPSSEPQAGDSQPGDAAIRAPILDVAYRLLEEHGYAAVTTDDIANAARVSKATIYRLWRTKQQLVVAATRRHFGSVDAPDLGSFRAEIHWILEHRLGDYRDQGRLRLVAELVGASASDPQLEAIFAVWVDQLSASIRRVVDRGVARGDVRADIAATSLVTLAAGVVARSVVAQQSFAPDVVESLVALLASAAKP
jgi:AcrR family transcriptional regulator